MQRTLAPEWIYRQKRWVRFPDNPLQVVNFEFAITKLVIPSPGEYLIVLTFDGNHVTERRMEVFQGD